MMMMVVVASGRVENRTSGAMSHIACERDMWIDVCNE